MSDKKMTAAEMLEAIKRKVAAAEGNRVVDTTKFSPPPLRASESRTWQFIVLPGYDQGDIIAGGKPASHGMDGVYFIRAGTHWLAHKNRAVECPRVFNHEQCAICDIGFSLLKEIPKEEEKRREAIRDRFLPRETTVVNVWFPPMAPNPEELWNQVRWFPISQRKVWRKFNECLEMDPAKAKDPLDPKAAGIFFPYDDPDTGEKHVCYVYKLAAVRPPASRYNEYDGSCFLPNSRGPIEKWLPQGVTFEDVMSRRYDLRSKYGKASVERCAEEAADFAKYISADSGKTDSDGGNDSGSDHKQDTASAPAPTAAVATPVATPVAAPATVAAAASSGTTDPEVANMIARLKAKKN